MQGRSTYFDNIKGALVFLVVLAHLMAGATEHSRALGAVYAFIYMFHIPLFVFMSGLMSKGASGKGAAPARFLGLYLFVSSSTTLFSDLVYFVFSHSGGMTVKLLAASGLLFLKNALLAPFLATGPSWYLLSLTFWRMVTPYLDGFDRRRVLLFSLLASLAVGGVGQIEYAMSLSRTIVFYPFFLAGYFVDSEYLEDAANRIGRKASVRLMALAVCAAVFAFCYFHGMDYQLLYGYSSYSTCGYGFLEGAARRGAALLMAATLSACALALAPKKRSVFTRWGSGSLGIYIWHIYLLPLAAILESRLSLGAWFSLVAAAVSVGACFAFSTPAFEALTSSLRRASNGLLFGGNGGMREESAGGRTPAAEDETRTAEEEKSGKGAKRP